VNELLQKFVEKTKGNSEDLKWVIDYYEKAEGALVWRENGELLFMRKENDILVIDIALGDWVESLRYVAMAAARELGCARLKWASDRPGMMRHIKSLNKKHGFDIKVVGIIYEERV